MAARKSYEEKQRFLPHDGLPDSLIVGIAQKVVVRKVNRLKSRKSLLTETGCHCGTPCKDLK
jgi:hypothetical protein